ncbi:thiamine pyrophosphate-dependent dehydrogenase E1 component subunit alpha [Thermanaerothrix sp. 4228-RoL]|uniref:2-oxoisovalerate dehydrogenase subunit alpha n=1 Tax=Thermanaerothrix solaris TaxID=3058434 RepID=A0ABU3NQH4_9CHLR|nr:thiamine pyrophosphate-dependent dehydrogenase E1 component subunit alpha [Thermanaerothrix sp. 4228-RoL]MDT8898645.1 thiamine pyrophosphate-dependent dehydrogenase E1 component subunit alpha [Thermanaerothrix sp. 4228-RoL]
MTLSEPQQMDMFWYMLLARRLDERAWVLHRQGKIAFHISGIGQEAAQIGAAFALRKGEDWVVPYYRDLALMLYLGYTPREFMLSLMGKREEPSSGGRQMPSHWSLRRANVVSHSAPVATQTPHAVGIALAIKMRREDKVVLTTIGEGATSQGEWYEAVNWAAIHRLPVIFMVENNRYAISEPVEKQMAVEGAAAKACGLGLEGIAVDGTDALAVYDAVARAVEKARRGEGPTLIEARMYRLTPHSSDDDDRSYRSREEVEAHKRRDPLLRMRQHLEAQGWLSAERLQAMEAEIKALVDTAVNEATQAPYPAPEEAAGPVFCTEVSHA